MPASARANCGLYKTGERRRAEDTDKDEGGTGGKAGRLKERRKTVRKKERKEGRKEERNKEKIDQQIVITWFFLRPVNREGHQSD